MDVDQILLNKIKETMSFASREKLMEISEGLLEAVWEEPEMKAKLIEGLNITNFVLDTSKLTGNKKTTKKARKKTTKKSSRKSKEKVQEQEQEEKKENKEKEESEQKEIAEPKNSKGTHTKRAKAGDDKIVEQLKKTLDEEPEPEQQPKQPQQQQSQEQQNKEEKPKQKSIEEELLD